MEPLDPSCKAYVNSYGSFCVVNNTFVIFILSIVCDMLPLITSFWLLFVCFTFSKYFHTPWKHGNSMHLVCHVMIHVNWPLFVLDESMGDHNPILLGFLSFMWDDPTTIMVEGDREAHGD